MRIAPHNGHANRSHFRRVACDLQGGFRVQARAVPGLAAGPIGMPLSCGQTNMECVLRRTSDPAFAPFPDQEPPWP
jgi:hypothetical protein